MPASALLRFSDVLSAQVSGELPYSRLKQLLRAIKSTHPRYPRRSRRPDGCSQICTLSQTQVVATQQAPTVGRVSPEPADGDHNDETEGNGVQGDGDGEEGHTEEQERPERRDEVLDARQCDVDDGDEERKGVHPDSLYLLSGAESRCGKASAVQIFVADGDESDLVHNGSHEHPSDRVMCKELRCGSASQTGLRTEQTGDSTSQPELSRPSEDVCATPSAQEHESNECPRKCPKRCRISSLPRSQSDEENQSTLSNPVVSRELSAHSPTLLSSRGPEKRVRISSSPPSHISIGVQINAILNALIEHDSERGESVKWMHLRSALMEKDCSLYEPFCSSLDRVFEPRDPLAAYSGGRGGSSQSSARMCVFYSNLFWQDAWKEFCYDCRRRRKFNKSEMRSERARATVKFR